MKSEKLKKKAASLTHTKYVDKILYLILFSTFNLEKKQEINKNKNLTKPEEYREIEFTSWFVDKRTGKKFLVSRYLELKFDIEMEMEALSISRDIGKKLFSLPVSHGKRDSHLCFLCVNI